MHRWLENSTSWVAIADNGRGMMQSDLCDAMKLGGHLNEEEETLGRFGFGLKTASISQCKKLTVITTKAGETCACMWDIEQAIRDNCWDAVILNQTEVYADAVVCEVCGKLMREPGMDGTIVLWQNIDAGFNTSQAGFLNAFKLVRKHLEMTFHRFLVKEKHYPLVEISMNGLPLKPFHPFGPDNNINRRFLGTDSICCNGHEVKFYPYVLPRSDNYTTPEEYALYAGDEGYIQNQGFYVYRNRRLIQHGKWFGLMRKAEKTQLLRIQVDFPSALDSLWKVNVMKSHIIPPADVNDAISGLLDRCATEAERQLLGISHERARRVGRGSKGERERLLELYENQKTGEWTYKIDTTASLYAALFKDEGIPEDCKARLRAYLKSLSEEFSGLLKFTRPSVEIKGDDKIEAARSVVQELIDEGRSSDEILALVSAYLPSIPITEISKIIYNYNK